MVVKRNHNLKDKALRNEPEKITGLRIKDTKNRCQMSKAEKERERKRMKERERKTELARKRNLKEVCFCSDIIGVGNGTPHMQFDRLVPILSVVYSTL